VPGAGSRFRKGGFELGEERYLFSETKYQEELSRLRLQESFVDPVTIRHLETIGVASGWRCLDVGAGTGSIAQWLSTRVGTTGKVIATDINTRFLSRLSIANLEVRQHDILKDELERGNYDLVHCRKLLHHLPQPEKALRKMAEAARPGGWLLVEEDDLGSVLSMDVIDSSAAPYKTAYRAILDYLGRKGIDDCFFGRRVRSLLEQIGFTNVSHEGWTRITRGGDPMALTVVASWEAGVKPLIGEEVLTPEEYETIMHLLKNPAFYYPEYTLFSAWGRKPEG
jgi:SAM-dependent methyltransferase